MKVYQCDSCGTVTEDPYSEKMREFYVGFEIDFDFMISFPVYKKSKERVQLCKVCYENLRSIPLMRTRLSYGDVRRELREAKKIVAKIEMLYGKNMLNVPKVNDNEILSKMIQIQNLIEQTLSDMEGESTDD